MEPGWLAEIEPVTSPPFVRMGTRALGRGRWLLGGDDVPAQMAEKRRILAAHHDEVVAAIAGTREAATELLETVRRQVAPPPAADRRARELHPIDVAGRLVPEDLCLLVVRDDGAGWVLGAGSVCFPSHWRLTAKLGLPLAAVHGPVPGYATELAGRVDRFLDRLRAGRGVVRRNWTVHTEPDLYAPDVPPPPDPPVTSADAGQRLWLRSERQTLTRLPRTGAIGFTIRTQQALLAAVAAHPELRARLAEAVAAWPPHQVAYRGGEAVRHPLLTWLRGT